jgi:SanA protein
MIKKILRYGLVILVVGTGLVVGANLWIVQSTQSKIYDEVEQVPCHDVALVLGTSKYASGGNINLYFKFRMEAAAVLYHSGKVKHILVSGDNSVQSYNEPRQMKKYLIELGVPSNKITLDYAGFRTLDSVVRAKKVFQQNSFTIVSQEFHNQRALFICRKYDIDAVAFNAKDVPSGYSIRVQFREYFAKFKSVLDLYLLQKEPKFLGDKEYLQID